MQTAPTIDSSLQLSSTTATRCLGLLKPLASLLVAASLAGCVGTGKEHAPLELAPSVDVEKMYGGWYIIATIPNRFEPGMVSPYDVYSPRPDGDIREDFYVIRGSFDAPRKHFTVHDWVRKNTHGAHWRVQLLWPINVPFLVLYVSPDYRYVLFGEENRSLGWIYSREPTMDDATYARLLQEFQSKGYDASLFRRIVHRRDQIGQPGFWSDGIAAPANPP